MGGSHEYSRLQSTDKELGSPPATPSSSRSFPPLPSPPPGYHPKEYGYAPQHSQPQEQDRTRIVWIAVAVGTLLLLIVVGGSCQSGSISPSGWTSSVAVNKAAAGSLQSPPPKTPACTLPELPRTVLNVNPNPRSPKPCKTEDERYLAYQSHSGEQCTLSIHYRSTLTLLLLQVSTTKALN